MINMDVTDYFNAQAETYQSKSVKWPWTISRKHEVKGVFQLLGDIAEQRILELGCGAGFYTRLMLAKNAQHIVAIDQSEPMLKQLPSENVTPVLASAESFQLKQQFSIIFSAGLLEFVNSPDNVFRTCHQHANDNAIMVLLLPHNNLCGLGYRIYHRRHGFNINLFNEKKLGKLAARTGWKVECSRFTWPFSYIVQLRKQ